MPRKHLHGSGFSARFEGQEESNILYILDEPTTGLHPSDVEKLLVQLNRLAEAGNTVIVVEHDMHVIAGADWIIYIGPVREKKADGLWRRVRRGW